MFVALAAVQLCLSHARCQTCFHWHTVRRELLQSLHKQNYTFLPLNVITKADGESI